MVPFRAWHRQAYRRVPVRILPHSICSVFASLVLAAAAILAVTRLIRSANCHDTAPASNSVVRRLALSRSSGATLERARAPCSRDRKRSSQGTAAENQLPVDGCIDSVARSMEADIGTYARVSIPQTIWQTARSHSDIPRTGTHLFNAWSRYNPGFDHFFLDDDQMHAFVEAHYNSTVVEAFDDMPMAVMRADVFRYASLPSWTSQHRCIRSDLLPQRNEDLYYAFTAFA